VSIDVHGGLPVHSAKVQQGAACRKPCWKHVAIPQVRVVEANAAETGLDREGHKNGFVECLVGWDGVGGGPGLELPPSIEVNPRVVATCHLWARVLGENIVRIELKTPLADLAASNIAVRGDAALLRGGGCKRRLIWNENSTLTNAANLGGNP
jgi:hypothetical protein